MATYVTNRVIQNNKKTAQSTDVQLFQKYYMVFILLLIQLRFQVFIL